LTSRPERSITASPRVAQPLGGEQVVGERRGIDGQTQRLHFFFELSQGERGSLLRFDSGLEIDDTAGLVPEGHVAALLVLDEVGGEHVTFRAPRPKQDTKLVETRLSRLGPKLPDGQKARVAAGLDDEVRLARPAGYGEGIAQAAGADRGLDLVELGVVGPPRVVLIGMDILYRELDLAVMGRIGLDRQVTGVVAQIADLQGLGDQPPSLFDRRGTHRGLCGGG
jgi:hypothetical protein